MSLRVTALLALIVVLAVPAATTASSAGDLGATQELSLPAPSTFPAWSSPNASSGGRASGHVELSNVLAGPLEKYSFTSIQTAPPPTAKGNVEVHVGGSDLVAKGDVVCMTIVGNRARIAALWESQRFGNVEAPPPPGQHLIWTVEDNGEGSAAPPDRASEIFQVDAAGGQFHCASGFNLPLRPNERGNVQVKPG